MFSPLCAKFIWVCMDYFVSWCLSYCQSAWGSLSIKRNIAHQDMSKISGGTNFDIFPLISRVWNNESLWHNIHLRQGFTTHNTTNILAPNATLCQALRCLSYKHLGISPVKRYFTPFSLLLTQLYSSSSSGLLPCSGISPLTPAWGRNLSLILIVAFHWILYLRKL